MFLTCLLDFVVDSPVGGGYQEGRYSNPDHGYEGEVGLSLALHYRAGERLVLKPELTPALGQREAHGAERDDPGEEDHEGNGEAIEVYVEGVPVEDSKDSL